MSTNTIPQLYALFAKKIEMDNQTAEDEEGTGPNEVPIDDWCPKIYFLHQMNHFQQRQEEPLNRDQQTKNM